MKTKRCSKCLKRKELSAFGSYKYSPTGIRNHCKKCRNQEMSAIYAKNPQKYIAETRKWRENNREKHNAYYRNRRAKDINFRLKAVLRTRLSMAVKHYKSSNTLKLLGCTLSELKTHLESQFLEGMSWENYGTHWHIDHIKPCASFDLTTLKGQRQCFHFSNLQPLWAKDNLRKNKFISA